VRKHLVLSTKLTKTELALTSVMQDLNIISNLVSGDLKIFTIIEDIEKEVRFFSKRPFMILAGLALVKSVDILLLPIFMKLENKKILKNKIFNFFLKTDISRGRISEIYNENKEAIDFCNKIFVKNSYFYNILGKKYLMSEKASGKLDMRNFLIEYARIIVLEIYEDLYIKDNADFVKEFENYARTRPNQKKGYSLFKCIFEEIYQEKLKIQGEPNNVINFNKDSLKK